MCPDNEEPHGADAGISLGRVGMSTDTQLPSCAVSVASDSSASESADKATFKTQASDQRLVSRSGDLTNIGCLRPFVSLDNFKFHFVAFLQALIAIARNGAIVDEYIRSAIAPQEAVPFRVIEPLDGAFDTFHLIFSLSFDSVFAVHPEEVQRWDAMQNTASLCGQRRMLSSAYVTHQCADRMVYLQHVQGMSRRHQ